MTRAVHTVRHWIPVGPTLLALLVGLGCAGGPKQDPNPPAQYVSPKIHDAGAPDGTYMPVDRVASDVLKAASANDAVTNGKKLNILTISGGGQFGSYAAGLMVGWSERGDRPQFDVVTGISSGALIATLVYVGPKYDPLLQHVFTTLETDHVFKRKPMLLHLIRDKSVASPEPLKQMLECHINDEFVAEMKQVHATGRRIYVGTMNVLTRRLTVWDLGAIASSGRPDAGETVRRILLATSSISGLVPPVPIDVEVNGTCVREYHADGGGVAQTFLRLGSETPRPDPANPGARWLAGSNLYVIGGGKLYKEILDKPPGFIGGILSNVSANLYALFRADCWRLYSFCSASGMKFHLGSVPEQEFTGEKSTEFDVEIEQRLFAHARELIKCGKAWRTTPPGYELGEEDLPRASLQFSTIPATPAATTAP